MSRITYLIGAGASFHSVPLVSKLNQKVLFLIEKILNRTFPIESIIDENFNLNIKIDAVKKELDNILSWLKDELGDNSIDTLAKQLNDLNQRDYLRSLKAILSAYIVFEHFNGDSGILDQANRDLDPRYRSFFARVSRKEDIVKINNSISVISWNYDLQFEKTYSKYYPNYEISEFSDFLNNYPSLLQDTNFDITKFKLVRLNGIAGSVIHFRERRFTTLINNFNKLSLEDSYTLFLKIYSFLKCPSQYYTPGIRFAFENKIDWYNPLIIAEKFLKNTEILIIIGYSFPDFNREYDSKLIKSMTSLKVVYVQDLNNIFNKINDIFHFESKLKPVIIHKNDLTEFFTPPIDFST